MTRKLYIRTFGCQMNEYDSARTADLLAASHGLERTARAEDADVLLVNTCSVREKAAEKVFSEIGRWRAWKEARPELVIGVGGCVASQEGAAIRERAPYVDVVYGPQALHRLPEMIDPRRPRTPAVDVSFPEIEKFDRLPEPRAEGPTAFVSVMEGCSKYCSFCVVPYTRGEEFSRPFDDVIAEVVALAEQGVREITFLGQNVNAYRGAMHDGRECDLALLIAYAAAIEGIDRIRYTTSHPAELTGSLIDVYAEVPELVSHLHLPVQSGSDRILALMKRTYTARDYVEKVRRLRAVRPDLSLSSDFIVGFPGRDGRRFRSDHGPHRRGRLRHLVLVHLQRPPRHPGRRTSRSGAPRREARAARPPSGPDLGARARRVRGHGGPPVSSARGRAVEEGSGRASRPHREQPGGELLRSARSRRHLRRRGDRGGASQFVAGHAGGRRPPWHPDGDRRDPHANPVPEPPTSNRGHPLNVPPARTETDILLEPADNERLASLCGPLDQHLRQLEHRLGVEITTRGNMFQVLGEPAPVRAASEIIRKMYASTGEESLTAERVHLFLQESEIDACLGEGPGDGESVKVRRGVVRGRGRNQTRYLRAVRTHDVNFGIGPAGTGKTYLAVACAVEALETDRVTRIVLVRPAVEAGERLGFLPGDLQQKVDPYLRPLFDALHEMLGYERTAKLMDRNIIEVAPLAYMRGRTLNESFIILDEAQNTSVAQMKMFLTRIGFGSTAVVTGDITQIDLPGGQRSGLRHAVDVLRSVKGITWTWFDSRDVVRHPMVSRILDAYDAAGEDGGG